MVGRHEACQDGNSRSEPSHVSFWGCAGKVLYEKVAELCPRHPGRSEKAKREAQAKQQAAASGSAPPTSKQSGKSGKKKRK